MRKNIPEKVIDVTGIELTPGEPDVCLGNGEQGLECCCDECDYCLLCYPEFDPENKEKLLLWRKAILDDRMKQREARSSH